MPDHAVDAAGEQHRLGHRSGEERHLAVERAGGAPADRSAASAEPVDDLAALDRDARGEGAPQLEQHERHIGRLPLAAAALVRDRQRRGADLVRGAQVDPVELPMARHRVEMDHAGGEPERHARRVEPARERPQPADAAGLAGRRQEREPKLLVADVARPGGAAGRTPRARPPDRSVPRPATRPAAVAGPRGARPSARSRRGRAGRHPGRRRRR